MVKRSVMLIVSSILGSSGGRVRHNPMGRLLMGLVQLSIAFTWYRASVNS